MYSLGSVPVSCGWEYTYVRKACVLIPTTNTCYSRLSPSSSPSFALSLALPRPRQLSDRLGVSAGGSFTANYSMHRKAFALQMREQNRRPGGAGGKGGGGGSSGTFGGGGGRGMSESSDDRTLSRFQKRDRKN